MSAIELYPTDLRATVCGDCGRGWDDSLSTSVTPTTAGRCPFEYEHENLDCETVKIDASIIWLVALAQQIVKLSGVSLAEALTEAEEHMIYGRENADYGGRLVI